MRMQTWRLLVSAVQADIPAAERMSLIQQFDESLALLRNGRPVAPAVCPPGRRGGSPFRPGSDHLDSPAQPVAGVFP